MSSISLPVLRAWLRAEIAATEELLTQHIKAAGGPCFSSCYEGTELRTKLSTLYEVLKKAGTRAGQMCAIAWCAPSCVPKQTLLWRRNVIQLTGKH